MSGGLREYWELPAINPDANGNGEFGQTFREGLDGVNQDMQVIAVRGDQAEHQKLDANRQTLIKAYQATNGLGDAAKNDQVMGAVAKVKQQTTGKADAIKAGYEEWQKRADAFDATVVKIGELEDANHPKAVAFRKVSDAIQTRLDASDFQNAKAAFDQLAPKLNEVIPQTMVQAGTGDSKGPGGGDSGKVPGGKGDSGKPAVPVKDGTIDSISSRGPSNSGGTIDASVPPQKSPAGDIYTDEGKTIKPNPNGIHVSTPIADDVKIRIKTSNGIEEMTVKEYRRRWYEADQWLAEETSKLKNKGVLPDRAGPPKELIKQAQVRSGLDDKWLSVGNRYIHGKDSMPRAGTPGEPKLVPNPGRALPGDASLNEQAIEKLQKTAADVSQRTTALNNKITQTTDLQQQSLSHKDFEKLGSQVKSYQKEFDEIRRVYEELDSILRAQGVQGSTTSEVFSNARDKFSKVAEVGQKVAPILILLVTAYTLFQQIKQIIEAKTDEERWKLTVQLVKGVWTGVESFVGATVILGSAGRAVPVLALVNISSDSPNRNYWDDKQELQKKYAEEKVAKIAEDLIKNHPDSVHWNPSAREFKVDDPKLWEQAVKKYELVGREQVLKAMEAVRPAARSLGVTQGLSDLPPYQEPRPALNKLFVPANDGLDGVRFQVLDQSFQEGYQEGQATRSAALKRAGELGSQDGKAGKPEHMEEVNKLVATKEWAEVDDTSRTTFHTELVGTYKKAYDAATPAGTPTPDPSNITAGEAVMRDKREAALKRAHELGLKDGKTGKKSHIEEIQKWTEVTEIEGTARAQFLAELIEIYNKEFASIAPADTATPVPSNITAGEKIARERKEAALKRARELGLKDGKSGTKSVEEIQKWVEVTEIEGPARATFLAELIEVYKKAFASVPRTDTAGEKVQRDKLEAALKRAHELGLKDGKTGKKSHLEELPKFPEVAEFGEKGGVALHGQLVVAYSKAFASVAPATPALLERARELGEQDAKAGMALHMPEIGKWPEVQGNDAMLQQLLEAYNKALKGAVTT